jgi:D-beta-D-heptose 7-phosphate kinase/D-beta-D-heptose 1-phosphate adenosyltransferase
MARTKNAGDKKKRKVVAVSGGFDPIHVGHVRMFREAKKLGDWLVVIINNDNWLRKKKGYVFMPQDQRKEIILALDGVDEVVISGHPQNPTDMSVREELDKIRPDIFANGGDRNTADARRKKSSLNRDQELCKKLGIAMKFNVGEGGKLQSSSWLVKNCVEVHRKNQENQIREA